MPQQPALGQQSKESQQGVSVGADFQFRELERQAFPTNLKA